MQTTNGIYILKGKVQHYAWGGYDYIPQLLHMDNTGQHPCAEYWLGAHPSAPSTILLPDEAPQSLKTIIENNTTQTLGSKVHLQFGELPFLLKILDVKDMLSIQVHPSKAEAEKGFDRENEEGIPVNAGHRNYKDRNHKPEVMVALSDFWLLHGFKNAAEIEKTLLEIAEFNFLISIFKAGGNKAMYQHVMELPQQQVDEILHPLVSRLLAASEPMPKLLPGFWAAKVFEDGRQLQNIDRGIFSIYFFNIVNLQPGEGIFQGAGVPHAYLLGQNVELMANSDNVLRGGLTPKHIDVYELLKHTSFDPIVPHVLKGSPGAASERNYPCPVPDFGISAIQLTAGHTYKGKSSSAEISIVITGSAKIDTNGKLLQKGDAFIVFADTEYALSTDLNCLIYKAFVP